MIAFINTIILSALVLSLIPIIIHFFNRRKSRVEPFSTLRFLQVLQKRKLKRIRLRQIL